LPRYRISTFASPLQHQQQAHFHCFSLNSYRIHALKLPFESSSTTLSINPAIALFGAVSIKFSLTLFHSIQLSTLVFRTPISRLIPDCFSRDCHGSNRLNTGFR
jgi:hypothetical protein